MTRRAKDLAGSAQSALATTASAVWRPFVHPWMLADSAALWHAVRQLDDHLPRVEAVLARVGVDPAVAGDVVAAVAGVRAALADLADALDEHGATRLDGPAVDRPADLPEAVRSLPAAGRGPVLYPEAFGPAGRPLDVSASVLAHLAVTRLAQGHVLADPQPLYLRRPDAKEQAPARVPGP